MFGQLFEAGEESCGRLGKDLVLFPDDVGGGFQPGGKGPKAQAAAPGVDELVKAKGVSEPLVHQQRGVVDEVVGGHHVETRCIHWARRRSSLRWWEIISG
mgnify:CR=1 FL=1